MTRKEKQRQEYEDHFYATWPNQIKRFTNEELSDFNSNKLNEINSSYPETMQILKSLVLQEMAQRGI